MTPVAVVTGSASGIGLATARLAAVRGWRVAGVDVASERPDGTVASGSGGCTIHADVADPAQVSSALDEAAALGPIDVVVSAAGILDETPLDAISDASFARTVAVHVGGLYGLIDASRRHMLARGGSIVAIASELVATGAEGHAHYVIAKAALVGLVRAAARELGPDAIRVNAVAPGPVDTPLLGPSGRDAGYLASLALGRLGRPDEIARAVMDVATWSWATGAVMDVNGGAVIRG